MQPTEFRNPDLGITVKVTLPAQKLIGSYKVAQVVVALTELMAGLGAENAYVGKAGSTIAVYIYRKDGWVGSMKVKKRRSAKPAPTPRQ